MFGFFRNYFSNDLAIDLGTANTLIYTVSYTHLTLPTNLFV